MTADQWRALPDDRKSAVWQQLTQEQRTKLTVDLLATTPSYGLPYPSNYSDPADSPSALQALAEAVEAAMLYSTSLALTTFVQGPTASLITDWDTATESGFWQSALGASNRPSASVDNSWIGMVTRTNADHIVQVAWPVGGGPVPRGAVHHRTRNAGTWGGWSRLGNWTYSWGTGDNMIGHTHGAAEVQRFATGLKKDAGSAAPTAADQWRVQCYDTSGGYTWTAIQVPESGVVTFPKGHSLLLERIASGEPIAADTPLTVGAFAAMLDRILGGTQDVAGLVNLAEPEED